MFSVFEAVNIEKPPDIDRIGTLRVINYDYDYSSVSNNFTYSERELNFHTCTTDDIDKFGQTAK
jgi:hypothetical protein